MRPESSPVWLGRKNSIEWKRTDSVSYLRIAVREGILFQTFRQAGRKEIAMRYFDDLGPAVDRRNDFLTERGELRPRAKVVAKWVARFGNPGAIVKVARAHPILMTDELIARIAESVWKAGALNV